LKDLISVQLNESGVRSRVAEIVLSEALAGEYRLYLKSVLSARGMLGDTLGAEVFSRLDKVSRVGILEGDALDAEISSWIEDAFSIAINGDDSKLIELLNISLVNVGQDKFDKIFEEVVNKCNDDEAGQSMDKVMSLVSEAKMGTLGGEMSRAIIEAQVDSE
jgi:hypothetical protein